MPALRWAQVRGRCARAVRSTDADEAAAGPSNDRSSRHAAMGGGPMPSATGRGEPLCQRPTGRGRHPHCVRLPSWEARLGWREQLPSFRRSTDVRFFSLWRGRLLTWGFEFCSGSHPGPELRGLSGDCGTQGARRRASGQISRSINRVRVCARRNGCVATSRTSGAPAGSSDFSPPDCPGA